MNPPPRAQARAPPPNGLTLLRHFAYNKLSEKLATIRWEVKREATATNANKRIDFYQAYRL